jgi:hypothetical protein
VPWRSEGLRHDDAGGDAAFERAGYSASDAQLKASGVIGEAQADPTFAKLIANTFDQEQMLRNDLTSAQIQVGAMEGRRDYAGNNVAGVERANVATEQGWRSGSNQGQREAASMLGLPVDETSRRVGFINALSGEARSTAITQLSRATGRNEAQVVAALERYNAAVQVGTADGASAEAGREGQASTDALGRLRAMTSPSVRAGSTRSVRLGPTAREARRASASSGGSRRISDLPKAQPPPASRPEAARLDSFIQALSRTAGNQVDMAEGGAAGIADRARNERLTSIVDKERLTRMQGLLAENGIKLSKRQIAMDQNGDLSLNLAPDTAAAMWKAGLINESQLGAIANGGHARFSFAHNDLLVSSGTDFSRSARSDTSTRFEAGKQAGPDTIEHFMGGGAEGQAMLANWLRGGFEMDRRASGGSSRRSPIHSSAMCRRLWPRPDGRERCHDRPRIRQRWEPQSVSKLGERYLHQIAKARVLAHRRAARGGNEEPPKLSVKGRPQLVGSVVTLASEARIRGLRARPRSPPWTSSTMMCVIPLLPLNELRPAPAIPKRLFPGSCRTASSVAKVCAIATSRTQMMVAPLSTSPGH